MRILHVHSGNLYGGVETVLRCFAREQGSAQHEFAFSFEGGIAAGLRALGCRVHKVGEVRGRDLFSVWRARHCLGAICRSGDFDATVMHSAWTLGLLGPAAARPLVFYQHDRLNGSHWTERLARRVAPDLIVANSAYTARSTPRAFGGQAAIVVHPPADLSRRRISREERNAFRARWGTADADVAILIAARFEPWKGHRLLAEALARLRANPRWVLWVAGQDQRQHEKQLLTQLLSFAASAEIASRVRLLGHVADVGELMQAADIYCQPNTEPEPFGLTFIEALHAGIPVVTTRLGGAEEILTPDTGRLIEPHAAVVADALEALIDRPELPRERGAARARELCEPERQVARFVQLIWTLRGVRAA